jgi:hypothetical protein
MSSSIRTPQEMMFRLDSSLEQNRLQLPDREERMKSGFSALGWLFSNFKLTGVRRKRQKSRTPKE